jgi:hypothetical protein
MAPEFLDVSIPLKNKDTANKEVSYYTFSGYQVIKGVLECGHIRYIQLLMQDVVI